MHYLCTVNAKKYNLQININELRGRINEINLLNKLRSYYVLPDSHEQLLLRVMCVLKEDLLFTSVYLYKKENGMWFFKNGTDNSFPAVLKISFISPSTIS